MSKFISFVPVNLYNIIYRYIFKFSNIKLSIELLILISIVNRQFNMTNVINVKSPNHITSTVLQLYYEQKLNVNKYFLKKSYGC